MEEELIGICSHEFYSEFQEKVHAIKNELVDFLISAKKDRKIVIGYGAAAKGNTILNFAGIRSDLLPMVVDNPANKINICLEVEPIVAESVIREHRPDYILILPWNLRVKFLVN